ncbi:uncharacterized protein TM35_000401350 [Trypanosoma theileri]|uniref:Uncharacterized protein n=1 Tax=Trypanosoma theileri TaxID=67003 RepID=A0A1X0NK36_9TRYP|nr:uncharacterized protein TM35_000401350 [Trypanosoma theileri]ORC84868.1 hypothetical protein TM35_000401350 [Trypanosoma theileri]
MGDPSHLTPAQLSRQQLLQQPIHQNQQIADSPQSELSIPTPAPRARLSGACSGGFVCSHNNFVDSENTTHTGVVHIDAMNTENADLSTCLEAHPIVCAATTLMSDGEGGSGRNVGLKGTPVNTIGATERLKRATCRRRIENEENNEGERVGCGMPITNYCFSLPSPSSDQRPVIENEMLNTPHALLRDLSDAAESPQVTLHARQQEHPRRQRLTSPLPDNDTDTLNSVMDIQKQQQQQRQQQQQQQQQQKNGATRSLSIPTPLPCKEGRTQIVYTSGRMNAMKTPPSEGFNSCLASPHLVSASISPSKEKRQQEQDTTTILCPEYDIRDVHDDYNRNAIHHSEVVPCGGNLSFARSGERCTPPRGVCGFTGAQSYQEPEPEQRGLAGVDTNSSALRLSPQGTTAGKTGCVVSPNTSVPVLVDWRAVVEESIVLDVNVDIEDDEEEDDVNGQDQDEGRILPPPRNGERKLSKKKAWCGTPRSVDGSLAPNDNHHHNNPQQLQMSTAQQSTLSWPPSVESVCETSVEGGESGNNDDADSLPLRPPSGMRQLLDVVASTANADTTVPTTNGTNRRISSSSSSASRRSSAGSGTDHNHDNDSANGCPPVAMLKPSSLLRGRMRTALTTEGGTKGRVKSPHRERRSESHSLQISLAVELCHAVRPFAQRLLLLLLRESDGGAFVYADACAEAVNSILESEGIRSVRATENLCRYIIASTSNNGSISSGSSSTNNNSNTNITNNGGDEGNDVNKIPYGDFVAGIMQLGEQN